MNGESEVAGDRDGRGPDGGRAANGAEPAALILVVEDEAPLRRLVVRMLRRMGFETLDAPDGEEGVRVARDAGDRLDLVLTDVVMPRLNGPRMVQMLREDGNPVRVGYMSGYSAEELTPEDRKGRFLAKPFTMEELQAFVESVLDRE